MVNAGAWTTRVGFWDPFSINNNKEPRGRILVLYINWFMFGQSQIELGFCGFEIRVWGAVDFLHCRRGPEVFNLKHLV